MKFFYYRFKNLNNKYMKYDIDNSGFGNEVLYRMCAEKPLHNDVDIIIGKLWLIGRSYSAAIERRAGDNFKISDAAQNLYDSDIDELIKSITEIDRTTEKNVGEVLRLHKYLTGRIKEVTGVQKRSLASKYLHFHAPKSVFIFDSIVNKNLRQILRSTKQKFKLSDEYRDKYDVTYADFCCRSIYYRDNILEKKLGKNVTPRRLDMELYNGYY